MSFSVGLVNLGCAKNQVDGEIMLAALRKAGFQVRDDASLADAAIVNTCAFINTAKQEAINEILELAKLKAEGKIKALLVTGCMAERYREQVMSELPEVDAVLGIGADADIAAAVTKALGGEKEQSFPEKEKLPLCGERLLLTPSWSPYLKIAEGCSNRCSYCAIPMIRGKYRSRPMESIVEEAERLAAGGAAELVLIAQDTTRYGIDLYGKMMLPELLRRLCRIKGIGWIRVLYAYPEGITDELLKTFAEEPKIVRYLDLPLQHCSEEILRSMRRGGNRRALTDLIRRVRGAVPGIVIRTTLIAGYPGETPEQFDDLCSFVREMRFERLGCFAYSQEEGTSAAALPGQIDEEEKQRRAEMVMEIQMNIMQELGEAMAGRTLRVLTEGFDRYADCWFGRSFMDSPDVDGKVYFQAAGKKKPVPGRFTDVAVTECVDGDLMGHTVV